MSNDNAIYGFDELTAAFNKIVDKYPSKADALLASGGRMLTEKTKSGTPRKSGALQKSWKTKKPKYYGNTKVVRTQSAAPHAHLVEQGHNIVRGGRARGLNAVQRQARGVQMKGRVEGKHMLEKALKEVESTFESGVNKLLDELTSETEL